MNARLLSRLRLCYTCLCCSCLLLCRLAHLNFQERTRHINLRKIPGTPAGCPWDTRPVSKQGSTGRCPRNFLLFTVEELPFLLGHRPGVPGTPGRVGDFQKIYVIFSYVPFLLPKLALSSAVLRPEDLQTSPPSESPPLKLRLRRGEVGAYKVQVYPRE